MFDHIQKWSKRAGRELRDLLVGEETPVEDVKFHQYWFSIWWAFDYGLEKMDDHHLLLDDDSVAQQWVVAEAREDEEEQIPDLGKEVQPWMLF